MRGADWDAAAGNWVLDTSRGTYTADVLVAAGGPLTEPSVPKLPGLETFGGEVFHSARWNHDYDLTGKRVAVIGTGASAVQFVPRIAPDVARLHVFQRTAPWVVPRRDRPFSTRAAAAVRRAHPPPAGWPGRPSTGDGRRRRPASCTRWSWAPPRPSPAGTCAGPSPTRPCARR